MKKSSFLLTLLLMTLNVSAQTSVTHTIQRGETIESVANKYGISVTDLQQANPDTKEYFYAGMKLTIPAASAGNNTTVVQQQNVPSQAVNQKDTPQAKTYTQDAQVGSSTTSYSTNYQTKTKKGFTRVDDSSDFEANTYNICSEAGFTYISAGNNMTGGTTIMRFSGGANFHITNNIYTSIRIGYLGSITSTSTKYNSPIKIETKNSLHSICLPLEAGYTIQTENRRFALLPMIGVVPAVSITGSSESTDDLNGKNKEKIKGGSFAMEGYAGLRIRIGDFNLGASYNIGLVTDKGPIKNDKGHLLFSIGLGF